MTLSVQLPPTFLARDVQIVAVPSGEVSFAIKAQDAVGNRWPVTNNGLPLEHCPAHLQPWIFEALGVREGDRVFATPSVRF